MSWNRVLKSQRIALKSQCVRTVTLEATTKPIVLLYLVYPLHCVMILNAIQMKVSFLKVKREELKSTKGKLVKIQEDLKTKKQMLKGVQNTFVAKVQTDLINSDPQKYLHRATTGQLVPNWLLVYSDVRKLERVSQGKVPSKSDIPDLIKCYNERFDILRSSPENNQDDNEHVKPTAHES